MQASTEGMEGQRRSDGLRDFGSRIDRTWWPLGGEG